MKNTGHSAPCTWGSGKKIEPHRETPAVEASIQETFQCARKLHQAGRLSEAETIYRQILEDVPDHAGSLDFLGVIAYQKGRKDDATELINQAIRIDPSEAIYHSHLGNVLRDQGRLDDAIDCYRKAISLKPDYAEAHSNLGNTFVDRCRLDDAIACYRKAIALKPDLAEAHNNLGNVLRNQGNLEEAIVSCRRALAFRPNYAAAYNIIGNAYRDQGNQDAATESFNQSLLLKPENNIDAHIGLGGVCLDSGRLAAAQSHFDQALAITPNHPIALAALSSLRKMTSDDLPWAEKAQHLLGGSLRPQEEMALCYALGKYNDDTCQYESAFDYYAQANHLKHQLAGPFDREGFKRFIDATISIYTPEAVGQRNTGTSASRRPLFIVGMPRSGTSLTEQIIASHPDVFGAGELRFWAQQANAHLPTMPFWHRDISLLQGFAAQYEAELQHHSATAWRVVDKMPGNFLYLGLIHSAFPEARILHTRRNPVDTCMSIYFQGFNNQHTYANDLEDLAFYYREYHRLMAHWRAVLPPEVFLDVPYEALIEDQEGWSRRIIDFIGLDWDERCLNFHETERNVSTKSNWQVRQKIYKTSKERWRNYEKFVGPLLPLLELAA